MIKRQWIWQIVFFLLLIMVLVLSTGCVGRDYVPNRDIIVIKLTPDGSPEWTKIIDNGFDDVARDLVELSDGGYAIAASISSTRFSPSYQPILIRLSPDGAIAWNSTVTDSADVATADTSTDDGGTAVLTGNGTLVLFDRDGRIRWALATGIPEGLSLIRTSDGGYLVGGRITYQVPVNNSTGAGAVAANPIITTATQSSGGPIPAEAAGLLIQPSVTQISGRLTLEIPRRFTYVRKAMVVKLTRDGVKEWERQYDENGLMNVLSLAEGSTEAGFLLAGEGTLANDIYSTRLLVMHIDPDGTPGLARQIGEATVSPWSIMMRSDPRGYRVLFQPARISLENYFREAVDAVLDPQGGEIERQAIDASVAVTWRKEGGYFSVGIPAGHDGDSTPICGWIGSCTYHALTFDNQGLLRKDRELPNETFDRVMKVMQTTDGGFALLAFRQNK